MTAANRPLFRASGADLRALVAQGNADAIAEAALRAAKPAKTVAALRSRGMDAEAQARIEGAKAAREAKPANRREPKPKAASTAVTFHRTRDSLVKVRADLEPRIAGVEQAVLSLAGVAASQHELLTRLTNLATAKVA